MNEQHAIEVAAPPEVALASARATAPGDVPVFMALMAVRSLPGLVRGRTLGLAMRRPIVDQFVDAGFILLAEAADEFVLGAVGRFWRPSGSLRPTAAGEFAAFAEPGWAKVAANFRALAKNGGCAGVHRDPRGGHRRRRAAELRPLLARDPAGQRADPPRLAALGQDPGRALRSASASSSRSTSSSLV